jgi:phosphoribosylanthranilate isomerase
MSDAGVFIKICGLSTQTTLEATIKAGADFAGFVFFEKSPRHVDLETARRLGEQASGRIKKVALVVDADDMQIEKIISALNPEYLQLHGQETSQRVAALKKQFGLPIIKAIGVASSADIQASENFKMNAEYLLLDAKPKPGAIAPGGAGAVFDWRITQGFRLDKWMLSGGLDCQNVAMALHETGAPAVDVSSGVESARGVKDCEKIIAFIRVVRALSSQGAKD